MGGTGQWLVLDATPSGTALSLAAVCPGTGPPGTSIYPASFPFSANATSFTLYNPWTNTVEACAKQ